MIAAHVEQRGAIGDLTREQRSGATAVDESFVYDALGNRLTKTDGAGVTTCTYNAANELVASTAPNGVVTTSSYDANGNLTLENAAGALTTYSWDGENRLLSVANAGGTETYAYSADGMRQKKVTGGGTAYVVRDGENVLIETDASLVTTAQHTDLPGMWGGKYAQRRSGASRFYVPDHQANTRVLLDAAATVTDTLVTDAWGVELARTGATVDPFMAFGQWGYWRDIASRLYVRARHLRVDQGRWVSRDPLAFGGGDWDVYVYGGSRPTKGVDPTGLRAPWIAPQLPGFLCSIAAEYCELSCGPKISRPLRKTVAKIRSHYIGSSPSRRAGLCSRLSTLNPFRAVSAWDIQALTEHGGGNRDWVNGPRYLKPTGRMMRPCTEQQCCRDTVAVDGECHRTYNVNYIAVGVMWRLCGNAFASLAGRIYSWKVVYLWDDVEEATAWASAGYHGWPFGPAAPASSPRYCKDRCMVPALSACDDELGYPALCSSEHPGFKTLWQADVADNDDDIF